MVREVIPRKPPTNLSNTTDKKFPSTPSFTPIRNRSRSLRRPTQCGVVVAAVALSTFVKCTVWKRYPFRVRT